MRLIDADEAMKFLRESKVKETGAFSKGINKGLNIALSALGNSQITPTVEAVVLPCKPLDTVYFIECHTDGNHQIRSGFASSVEYFVCYKPLVTIRYNDNTLESTKHYLGLKAFMTRAEAEAALAKMKGGASNV